MKNKADQLARLTSAAKAIQDSKVSFAPESRFYLLNNPLMSLKIDHMTTFPDPSYGSVYLP